MAVVKLNPVDYERSKELLIIAPRGTNLKVTGDGALSVSRDNLAYVGAFDYGNVLGIVVSDRPDFTPAEARKKLELALA